MPFDRIETTDASRYNRLTLLLYGTNRVGKTTAFLDVCRRGDVVFVMSLDKGLRAAYDDLDSVKGRLFPAYPKGLLEIRADLADVTKKMASIAASRQVDMRRVWFVVDTLTHMQSMLLTECRKIAVKNTNTPRVSDSYVKDATTQVDYNILHGLMNEIVTEILALPCNILLIAQEKKESDTKVVSPALAGASIEKFRGDCDIIARMIMGPDGSNRYFVLGGPNLEGGFRGLAGKLADVEYADLGLLRDKYLAMGNFAPKAVEEKKA